MFKYFMPEPRKLIKKLLLMVVEFYRSLQKVQNLEETIKKAYQYIGKKGVYFKGMQYRKDIGKNGLIFGDKYD